MIDYSINRLGQLDSHLEEQKLEQYLTSYANINARWIKILILKVVEDKFKSLVVIQSS